MCINKGINKNINGRLPVSVPNREIIKILKKNGWYEVESEGSHIQFKHPEKRGRVTVPHPKKDFPIKTLKSIEKQSGIKFK